MPTEWFHNYIALSFRIQKLIRKSNENNFVDYYYGPTEWQQSVEAEAETPAAELVRQAMALTDSLPSQNLAAHRETYLAKQLLALETVSRKLNGEKFPLQEDARRCLDILPTWVPEARFEEAHALLEEALPGTGSVSERMEPWRKHYELPSDKSHLLVTFMRQAMNEAQRRVQALWQLPQGEDVELEIVADKVYLGQNSYLGNYRSHVEINTDLPMNLLGLLDFACHEGYPGHHTEFVLKEQFLYREQDYLEHTILPIIGPQSVISEGIATSAFEMIFTSAEAEQWLSEHIYPEAGIVPLAEKVDREKIRRANDLLTGVDCNAAFMLNEGRPHNEILQYWKKYGLLSDEEAQKGLEYIQVPFSEPYIFSYSYGHSLMQPWLSGPDCHDVFKRFLTEQLYPSELVRA